MSINLEADALSHRNADADALRARRHSHQIAVNGDDLDFMSGTQCKSATLI